MKPEKYDITIILRPTNESEIEYKFTLTGADRQKLIEKGMPLAGMIADFEAAIQGGE